MPTQQHGVQAKAGLEEPPQPDPSRPEPGRRRKRRSNDPTKPAPRRDKPRPETPHDPQDLPSQEVTDSARA